MRTMLIVAKPVTWTLIQTGHVTPEVDYNDILSCVGKPKGSVTMSQKYILHSVAYYAIFGRIE